MPHAPIRPERDERHEPQRHHDLKRDVHDAPLRPFVARESRPGPSPRRSGRGTRAARARTGSRSRSGWCALSTSGQSADAQRRAALASRNCAFHRRELRPAGTGDDLARGEVARERLEHARPARRRAARSRSARRWKRVGAVPQQQEGVDAGDGEAGRRVGGEHHVQGLRGTPPDSASRRSGRCVQPRRPPARIRRACSSTRWRMTTNDADRAPLTATTTPAASARAARRGPSRRDRCRGRSPR